MSRAISSQLLAHLGGDTRTLALLVLVTRKDGQIFGFTNHDQAISLSGQVYGVSNSHSSSAVDMTSDLSTSNMELRALLDGTSVTQSDLEAGLWDNAAVVMSLCNYSDLTQGAVVVAAGSIGQVKLLNGQYAAELRSLSQMMQQQAGQIYSPTCRASLGDSRCTIALGPLTFTGSVQSVNSLVSWNDATLTQTGPTVSFVDAKGQKIPTTGPYTIQVVPPTGGAFVANASVTDATGAVWTQLSYGSSPGAQQYTVSPSGLYLFDGTDNPGYEVFINYTYSIGYFAYGTVKFTSGANAGYTLQVGKFAPGVVTLDLPPPHPLNVGDTYTIVAGCDRQFGTCKNRFNNVVHFRGEPYVPGMDTILRPQST